MSSSPAQPSLLSSLVHATDTAINSNPTGISQAETLVQSALNEPEAIGVLQCSNRMDVAELLNPAAETHNIFDVMDGDSFRSVMDAKKLKENNTEGDDGDVSAPLLTRHDALQAALGLRNYVGMLSDDLFSRKLATMLGSFGHQTRAVEMQGL